MSKPLTYEDLIKAMETIKQMGYEPTYRYFKSEQAKALYFDWLYRQPPVTDRVPKISDITGT